MVSNYARSALPSTIQADFEHAVERSDAPIPPRDSLQTWSAAENQWPLWQTVGNGLSTLIDKGDRSGSLISEVLQVNELEESVKALTDQQLQQKTLEFQTRLQNGEELQDIRHEAFAVAREACRRVTGMRPYDVQILAGFALDEGHVAEMATGEGKTLAAVAPTYLNALAGKGAHVVTVNETLAARDREKMGPIYEFLGLSVGLTANNMSPADKRLAYDSDITYGSNDVFGFDFLRDRKALSPEHRSITREPFFCLVDEVDQVLIDEATTPLIISGPGEASKPDYEVFTKLVQGLVPKQDLRVDSETLTAELTEFGYDKIENELSLLEALKSVKEAQSEHQKAVLSKDPLAQAAALAKKETALKWGESAVKMRGLLRDVGEAGYELEKYDRNRPSLLGRLGQRIKDLVGLEVTYDVEHRESLKSKHDSLEQEKVELQSTFPKYALFDSENSHRARFLQAAVQARALFHQDIDYAVIDGELEQLEKALRKVDSGKLLGAAQAGLKIQLGETTNFEATTNLLTYSPADLGTSKFEQVAQESVQTSQAVPIPSAQDTPKNRMLMLRQIASQADGSPLSEAEVKLIDEFKGRIGEGRRFTSGLHQALEAKEGLTVRPEQDTIASTTYPAFFGRYQKFSGMTGTAASAREEFQEVLGLDVVSIPRHKPLKRTDLPDLTFASDEERDQAIHARVLDAFHIGIPVLVTTSTVEHNIKISSALTEAGVPHHVLNTNSVKQSSAEELRIIGEGGRSGSVIIATNMAGRGQDIKPEMVNFKRLSSDIMDWLHNPSNAGRALVVDLEKEKQATRLGEWIAARAQGGTVEWSISDQEDPRPKAGQLIFRHGHDSPIPGASRIQGSEYPTGGLLVLGAGRNKARRIDEQLQGRSGRQGKVGMSQFFVSLDDELIEHNISEDRIKDLKPTLRSKGTADPSVASLTKKAQSLVESQSQSARKETVKREQIMQLHRKEYYGFRSELVERHRMSAIEVRRQFVAWSTDAITEMALADLAGDSHTLDQYLDTNEPIEGSKLVTSLQRAADSLGLALPRFEAPDTRPQEVYDILLGRVEKLLESGLNGLQEDEISDALRTGMLRGMDAAWTVHLDQMEQLKTSVQLVSYAEKDPELEFKFRAFDTFLQTVRLMRQQATAQVARSLVGLQRQHRAKNESLIVGQ